MKRSVLRGTALLSLAAMLNVVIAWSLALLVDECEVGTYNTASASIPGGIWLVDTWSCPGAEFIHSVRRRGSLEPGNELSDPSELLPYWSRLARPTPEFASGASDFEKRFVEARGWPMLSLRCSLTMSSGAPAVSYSVASAWETPWIWNSNLRPRTLPLSPVLLGFVSNTVLYAALIYLLIRGPIGLRRFVRRCRGQCLSCGYPTGHSKSCPECDSPLSASRASSHVV
nr:putative integron gene cassette protein [uncultured bacterium]